MSRNKKILYFSFYLAVLLIITGYVYLNFPKHTAEDDALYKWVSSEKEYVYHKNNSEILPTSEETERAHDNFMRIRFNKIALSVLNEEGKLPKGMSFPDSSIIIKEIYSDKSLPAPDILAVMVKLKGSENSNKDWLWGEYTPAGDVEYSVKKNGKVCVSCHKPGTDYVRVFDILK